MRDDDLMDGLLKRSLAAPAPDISRDFDARLMRELRPRRLTAAGQVVMWVYGVMAAGATAWLMRDLGAIPIAAALAVSVAVGAGASGYARQLASNT